MNRVRVKLGIIGMGNMGCKYAEMIQKKVQELEIAAVTRIRPENQERMNQVLPESCVIFSSAEELFSAVKAGSLVLDAVLIATPHYAHQEQTIMALKLGLHVLCDKPAGVYSRQGREMKEEADKHNLIYAMMFNQRTNSVYQRMKELVENETYGKMKRVNWIVTDWYRPDFYYRSSGWRATWEKDGGELCSINVHIIWICYSGFAECRLGYRHFVMKENTIRLR